MFCVTQRRLRRRQNSTCSAGRLAWPTGRRLQPSGWLVMIEGTVALLRLCRDLSSTTWGTAAPSVASTPLGNCRLQLAGRGELSTSASTALASSVPATALVMLSLTWLAVIAAAAAAAVCMRGQCPGLIWFLSEIIVPAEVIIEESSGWKMGGYDCQLFVDEACNDFRWSRVGCWTCSVSLRHPHVADVAPPTGRNDKAFDFKFKRTSPMYEYWPLW